MSSSFITVDSSNTTNNSSSSLTTTTTVGPSASVSVFVPGRVCMLGEHSDWSASYKSEEHSHIHPGACLAYNTDCGITLEGKIVTENSDNDEGKLFLEYDFNPHHNRHESNQSSSSRAEEEEQENFSSLSDTTIAASPLSDMLTHRTKKIPFSRNALNHAAATEGNFFAHVCGTCAEVLSRIGGEEKMMKMVSGNSTTRKTEEEGASSKDQVEVTVVKITCTSMTLPMKKGLSSSAAIGVGLAKLLGKLLLPSSSSTQQSSDDKEFFTTSELMDIAYCGEHRTGSKCGRLDQCVAFGPRAFIKLDFQGGPQLPVCTPIVRDKNQQPFYFVVCDLNASKNTKRILFDLNSAFPIAKDATDQNVQDALGPINLKLVERAENALAKGDAAALGKIFSEAQDVFDSMIAPKCLSELAAPKLHRVLQHPEVKKYSLGGKGVGSQGDGSAQFVCRNSDEQEKLCQVLMSESEALNCTPMKFCLEP